KGPMRFLREYKFVLSFTAVLTFCSVMVLRQIQINQTRHFEVREAFILLYTRGYKVEAQRLYNRLLRDLESFSNQALFEVSQRFSVGIGLKGRLNSGMSYVSSLGTRKSTIGEGHFRRSF